MKSCTLIFLIVSSTLLAQKEDYVWCLGAGDFKELWQGSSFEEHTGNTFIDFNQEPPLIYQDEDIHNQYRLANSQINTAEGEPLLYSNGLEIRTYLNDTLDGGGIISHSELWDELVFFDQGIRLTYGTNVTQSHTFVPIPESDSRYLLFYSWFRTPGSEQRLLLAEIDMSLNDGKGKVIYKDSILRYSDDDRMSNFLRPVRHANGRDWWILAPDLISGRITKILIDPSGINFMGQQEFNQTGVGQAKYSPDGRFLAIAECDWLFSPQNPENTIKLYEVDRCSGNLEEVFSETLADCRSTTGTGFSPDSRYMFYTNIDEVLQIDLLAEPIGSIIHTVWRDEGQRDSIYFFNAAFEPIQMQLGPDNRMYVPAGGRAVISIMHKPWLEGAEVEYEDFAIIAPTQIYPTTPNILNPRLGPVDGSACDTLGLDNNPVAQFRCAQEDSLNHLLIGFVDLSYMEPTTWLWDFGDGHSAEERYPIHEYTENGIYEVCLTVSNQNSSDTFCKSIQLGLVSTEDSKLSQPYVSLYPQPAQDLVRMAIHNYLPQDPRVLLYDGQGKLYLEKHLEDTESTIDISMIPTGVYYYQVWDGTQLLYKDKLVRI